MSVISISFTQDTLTDNFDWRIFSFTINLVEKNKPVSMGLQFKINLKIVELVFY